MAIQVEASKDIREYKINQFGPFDTRQVLCLGISLAYSIPIASILPISADNKVIIGLILAFPVAACGFIKLDGCYFEVLALRLIYMYFLTPLRRKTVIKNTYKTELKRLRQLDEIKKMEAMTAKEKKKYLKSKANPVIKYSKTNKVYR